MPDSCIYVNAKKEFLSGVHDLSNAGQTYKVMLVKLTYTPDRVNHHYVSDIKTGTDYEITTSGTNNYVRKTLTNKALTILDAELKVQFTADDLSWDPGIAAAVGQVGGAVIFRDRGGADTANELLFFLDLTDATFNNGVVSLSWPAVGVMKW